MPLDGYMAYMDADDQVTLDALSALYATSATQTSTDDFEEMQIGAPDDQYEAMMEGRECWDAVTSKVHWHLLQRNFSHTRTWELTQQYKAIEHECSIEQFLQDIDEAQAVTQATTTNETHNIYDFLAELDGMEAYDQEHSEYIATTPTTPINSEPDQIMDIIKEMELNIMDGIKESEQITFERQAIMLALLAIAL